MMICLILLRRFGVAALFTGRKGQRGAYQAASGRKGAVAEEGSEAEAVVGVGRAETAETG